MRIFGKNSIFIKTVIWTVVGAFVLSVFLIAGNFRSNMSREEAAKKRKAEQEKLRLEKQLTSEEKVLKLAEVNGSPITLNEFFGKYNNLPPETKASLKDDKKKVEFLEQLINIKILKDAARKLQVSASRAEMIKEIQKQIKSIRNIDVSDTDAAKYLDGAQSLKEQLEYTIVNKKVKDALVKGKKVSEKEVEEYFNANKDKFKDGLEKNKLKITKILKLKITESDIRAYYENHRSLFQKPDQYRVLDILIDPVDKNRKKRIAGKLTEDEMKRYWHNHREKYINEKQVELEHIFISKNKKMDISVSDKEIENYYNKNKKDFMNEPQVKASHILIDPNSKKWLDKVSITNKEVLNYYNDHKDDFIKEKEVKASHILVKTLSKAKEIRSKLDKGASFEKLAKEFSTDKSNSDKGGDLGYFNNKTMVPPFTKAAFNMKIGEVSDPVKTRFGYHIIKLYDIKKAETLTLGKARAEITSKLKKIKANKLAKDFANNILKKALKDENFSKLAKQYSDAKSAIHGGNLGYFYKGKIPENFPIETIKNEITMGTSIDFKFEKAVFSIKKGEVYPKVVETNFGFHIIKVFDKKEAEPKPLVELTEKIKDIIIKNKKTKAAYDLAKELSKKIKNNEEEFTVLASQYSDSPSSKRKGYLGYIPKGDIPEGYDTKNFEEIMEGKKINYKIEKLIFSLSMDSINSIPLETEDGYHVFKVIGKKKVSYKEFVEVKDKIKETLIKRYSQKDAKELSERVLQEALQTDDFSKLIEKYSDGSSKYSNGDVGYFILGIQDENQQNLDMLRGELAADGFDQATYKFGLKLDPEIERTIKYMSKDEISPVIHSQFGYNIIKFVGKRPGDYKKLNEVKDKIKENLKVIISEKEIEDNYNKNKDKYKIPASVKARHILVKTEEEAKGIKKQLNSGKDFAELAKKYSIDHTKDNGGDLGWKEKGKMPDAFDKVAFSIPVGNISDVVKTEFGYHIIQVLERKEERTATLAEKHNDIENQLLSPIKDRLYMDFFNENKNAAKIKVFSKNFSYFSKLD